MRHQKRQEGSPHCINNGHFHFLKKHALPRCDVKERIDIRGFRFVKAYSQAGYFFPFPFFLFVPTVLLCFSRFVNKSSFKSL